MTIAEILQQVHDLQMTPQQAEPLLQEIVEAAVATAARRDDMAMCLMTGMLAGRADTSIDTLVDRAYEGADKMVQRRLR